MSVSSVADIVEWSVLRVDSQLNTELPDKRSMYAALYRYQSEYDTKFTHFRVMDRLIAARFVYAVHVREHPDYALFRDVLDAIICSSVLVDPRLEYDEEKNPEAGGFICDPVAEFGEKETRDLGLPPGRRLYIDAGSPLWRRMVDAGRLTGMDALPPTPMSTAEVVAEIVTIAARDGDYELIRAWLAALYWDVDRLTIDEIHAADAENRRPRGRDLAVLKANPHIRRVRSYAKAVDALSVDLEYGEIGVYAIPTCDDLDVSENVCWWFDLDQDTDAIKAMHRAPAIPRPNLPRVFERQYSVLPHILALIVCIVYGVLFLRQRLKRRARR